jgi:alpha-glucosidase
MIDWKETILTGGTKEFIDSINPKLDSKISIKIKLYKENPVKNIFIRIAPNGEQIFLNMNKTIFNSFFQYYEISFQIVTKITNYRFGIVTEDNLFWFNSKFKLFKATPPDIYDFKIIAEFENPDWVKESIFYQIFPDRFFDGNQTNNVKNEEYSLHGKKANAREWDDEQTTEHEYPNLDFFGGDLAGIMQKIPYLKQLGISSLYLNPIFHAPSNHKYDILDYKKIDPYFGSNKEFADLVKELHKNGIKIILDGIFNHTGEGHRWFNKLNLFKEKIGAYNSKDSPYFDFYTFVTWPEEYISWMGHKSLPKLNYRSERLRQEMYKNSDSVMKFWLDEPYNIDGWRIDVANMLARQDESQLQNEIWKEIRKEIKNFKKNSYLLGEHFFDGSGLLDGEKLDAIMNYQGFNFPLLKWLIKEDLAYILENNETIKQNLPVSFTVSDFKEQLENFRALLPFQLQLLNFNLLSSHDVPRFLTRIKKDQFHNIEQYKLALIFLFTYIGVPCIYYGDETGMEGSYDPDNRRPMNWKENTWNQEIYQFYKKMIEYRNIRKEIQNGLYIELYAQDEIYSYSRIDEKVSIILLNNNQKNISNIFIPLWRIGLINTQLKDYLTDKIYIISNGSLTLHLKPFECLILS